MKRVSDSILYYFDVRTQKFDSTAHRLGKMKFRHIVVTSWIRDLMVSMLSNNSLPNTTQDIHKILHVSAPRCHFQGAIATKMQKPNYYMFCLLAPMWLVINIQGYYKRNRHSDRHAPRHWTQHAHPQCSIDCSSIEHLSEGTRNAPWRWQCNAETEWIIAAFVDFSRMY
jgi:hypothetical protein